MLSGSQISPTIDTSFLRSLCPNQIIKITLIKLTDTKKKGKKTEKLEGEKNANGGKVKEKSKQKSENKDEFGLKLISLVFCFFLLCAFFLLDIYSIDFRMVVSPQFLFPSPLDHALQSTERCAAPKIHCHLKKIQIKKVINFSCFFHSEIIFVHARLN